MLRSSLRLVARIVAALLLAALLALGAGFAWLGTQQSLLWIARQAAAASEGRLELDGLEGSLYDRIRIARAVFRDGSVHVEAHAIALAWRPEMLFERELRVTELTIGDLRIATADAAPSEPPQLPAALRLPLDATIVDARVKRIELVPGKVAHDLHFRIRARADGHALELVNVTAPGWRAAGTFRLAAAAPFAAAGTFDIEGDALGERLRVRAALGGNLEALDVQASAAARGVSAAAAARLAPFATRPVTSLSVEAQGVDLAVWDKRLPGTKIDVSFAASMPEPERLTGTVRVENYTPGSIDARRIPLSHAAFAFTGGGTSWNLHDIDILIGKTGRARGSGSVEGTSGRLELVLAGIDAADLHGRLRRLAVSGRATLTGDPTDQRLTARLEGAGAQLELAAHHAQQVITVERGALRAEGARLEFTGRGSLAQEQEFSADAAFSGLDPARFIDMPPARLNGSISAQGALAPDWRAQVRVALRESRLRGQPLEASARFSTGARQLFSGEAHALYAGNRLDVSGRFGGPEDQLNWSLAAVNLKAIDRTLSGHVSARGTLGGRIDRPSVAFKLKARGLVAGVVAASAIDAEGALDAGDEGALRIRARIAGMKARAATLEELRVDARGTRLRHEITAVLRGAGIDASLGGAGGLDDSGRWTGSVAEFEARGRFPFRLTAPARLVAGRGLLEIEDLKATALGGEIGPAALRIAPGRIATRGEVKGITAKALLALAPRTDIDPRDLAIGGRWAFALGETVSGTAELHRETGDLGVRAEGGLLLGLNQLSLNVSARDDALDAVLEAQSARMGTLSARIATRIERRDGAWVLHKDAPLAGFVALDIQSLAWLQALAPRLDQVGGRAVAQLDIAGTAGQPLITGKASADDIQVRAIGPGLHLREGLLRARFDGRKLNVDKFQLKAGDGTLEAGVAADLSSGLRSLDIMVRAERARILASPRLTVVLSGNGRAGLRDNQLALDGEFKIDEGRYDLGSERKPELGDDVVVPGRKSEAESAGKAMNVALDVKIELNDKFAVRGHGLDAVLGGAIRIATRGGSLHSRGAIRTVRGDYYAFGQVLDIQRGELNFSGPLGNPGLNVRAARKIRSVEVGVEVSGSAQRPVVKLVSDPAMSDSERLGWLLLGRDPRTASAAELAILQAAALTAGTRRTTSMQQKLAEDLGLDEVGIRQGGEGAVGVLALGKRVTDQLTVRLEQGLGGTAGGLMKIDYLLSERWRLEATAGAESAADILFTLRFD